MNNLTLSTALLALFFITGCSQGSDDSLESKRGQLEKYKEELAEITKNIETLEKEIIELSDSADIEIPSIAVRVEELKSSVFRHPIDLQGVVESEKNVVISPEVGGTISEVKLREGDKVVVGQVLATINADLIDKQIAEVKNAFDLANTTYERQKNLWEKNIGSELQYLQTKSQRDALEKQISTLQAQKSKYIIRSTIDGTVDEIFSNQGEIIGPGSPLARVVDSRNIKITADVSEKYLGKFKLNDTVSVQFPAVGKSTTGKVKAIGQVIHPGNRTFKLTISISNTENFYKPNLLAVIKAYDEIKENSLMVPTRLIELINGKNFLYVADINGIDTIAKRIEILIGNSAKGETVVTSGLHGGEWIITEGYKSISEGDLLHIITE